MLTDRRQSRRALGAFYTPPDVARLIAARTMSDLAGPLRVIDPACGDGEFLIAAWNQLRVRLPPQATLQQRGQWAAQCLFGVDIDEAAVAATRQRLLAAVLDGDDPAAEPTGSAAAALRSQLTRNIRCADGLLDEAPLAGAGFDVVLTNPPFLNSRRQSQQFGDQRRQELRRRFATARGAYDLFVLFIERAWLLLREGGCCGAIVPNKLAVLDYAQACRRLLSEQADLQWIVDASRVPLFPGAGVYPLLIGFRKSPPSSRAVDVYLVRDRDSLGGDSDGAAALPEPRQMPRQRLAAGAWRMHSELDVESRVPTTPAGQLATWHAGTAGFAAQRTADMLREADQADEPGEWAEFIVSGSIERYRVSSRDVRFMKRRWRKPVLNVADPALSPRRRRLYQQPKIVVGGMSQRLAAAWDDRGRALGVQAYAATDLKASRLLMLALLNSTLLSCLFRIRFSGKRLAGGYFSVNKSQLTQLPMRQPDDQCPLQREIISLAAQREAASDQQRQATLDRSLDRLVMELYNVTERELQTHLDRS